MLERGREGEVVVGLEEVVDFFCGMRGEGLDGDGAAAGDGVAEAEGLLSWLVRGVSRGMRDGDEADVMSAA